MVLLYIIFFAVMAFVISSFVVTLRSFFKQDKEFENYLHRIRDTETLYDLGVVNKFGMLERRPTRFYEVEGKLLGKFNSTGDIKYKEYFDMRITHRKKLMVLFVLPFFITTLFFILREIIL